MNLKPRLSYVHKMLLLISVPLLFELVFVGSLAIILKKVEAEKEIVDTSRKTLLAAERLYRSSYDLAQTLVVYQSTGAKPLLSVCRRRMRSINEDLSGLEVQLASNSRYAGYPQRIHSLTSQLLEAINILLSSYSVSDPTRQPGLAAVTGRWQPETLPADKVLLEQIRFESKELIGQLNSLCEQERKIERAEPTTAKRLRSTLEGSFWLGVCGSIVLSIALAIAFNNDTTRRLNLLVDNSNRLASGDKLMPPFGGHDEIAVLDSVFHQMARSLAESTERLRGTIDCNPLALITTTDSGIIESSNPRTCEYFGYANPAELLGKELSILLEHPNQSTMEDVLSGLIQFATERSVERVGKRCNGELFPVEVTLSRFNIASGQRWLIIIEDITELRQTQRMKQELTAIVSHELRTPLTSMQVFLSSLALGAYGELKTGAEKRISGIQRSVRRLIGLINDLLDSEKMAAGQLSITCTPMCITDAISMAIDSIREFAEKGNVTLVVDSVSAMVNGDVDRLAQVVVNLTSNAIKFSPEASTVKITVSILEDKFVEVLVTDQGPGIAKDFHELIFERFHQVQQNTARAASPPKIAGTGLGLSLSKYLVEKHGGTIGVTSEYGAGSTFWFRLPLLQPGASEGGEREENLNAITPTDHSCGYHP